MSVGTILFLFSFSLLLSHMLVGYRYFSMLNLNGTLYNKGLCMQGVSPGPNWIGS